MIEARSLTLSRGGRRLVHGVDLTCPAGTVTVLAGPNGAGKSTLVRGLAGDLRPAAGTVAYHGTDIARQSPRALARLRAVVPQTGATVFPFTVLEVVRLGAEAGGRPAATHTAEEALARVGLDGFAGRAYGALSGGERQRADIARALAQVPRPVEGGRARALFLDEPTASLDLRHQIAVLTIARDFAAAGGTVVAVLHDLNLAAEFADRLLLIAAGRLVAAGSPGEVIRDSRIAAVYGVSGMVGRLPPAELPFLLPQARDRSLPPAG